MAASPGRVMHPAEHALYALVVAAAFCRLLLDGARLSREFDAGGRWDGHAPGLRPGWIAGRRADLSDAQWRTFRAGLPPLAVALAAFAAASRALRRAAAPSVEAAVRRRAALHAAAAAAFLIYLHGAGAALVFALVAACHAAARLAAGSRHGAAAIWAANMGALAAARYTNGAPAFFASLPLGLGARLGALDALRGAGVRWHVCYNLTALRVLSHGLDLHWRRRAASGGDSDAAQDDAKRGGAPPATPRGRARTPLPAAADYSLLPALAHALYPPLYLAGPLVTFQDYAWQLRAGAGAGGRAAPSLRGALARCAARLLADLAAIEVLTHFLYFNSLAVHRVGARLRPAGLPWGAPEAGLAAWWVLAFMWLKFAAIWRFFRAAALLEGLDPPENMRRCFADNCDAAGFWRGWHASFNRWLVRYLYVPLGGGRSLATRLGATAAAFLFVALWHDLEPRLLGWGALAAAALAPELAVKAFASARGLDPLRPGATRVRLGAAALAALDIAALMGANMVGFVVGMDGAAELAGQLLAAPRYVAAALGAFFAGAQLVLARRGRERAAAVAGAPDDA